MIRVTVELPGPGGRKETRNVEVWNRGATSEAERSDPGGERMYVYACGDIVGSVRHHRRDGADALLAAVFAALAG